MLLTPELASSSAPFLSFHQGSPVLLLCLLKQTEVAFPKAPLDGRQECYTVCLWRTKTNN